MARPRGHDGERTLFAERYEKFAALGMAVDQLDDVSRGRRGDLVQLVEMFEKTTMNDGRCRLTREEIGERLRWGKWKVDEVRRLAEELGWIEVDRSANRSGQGANKVRVKWEAILKDSIPAHCRAEEPKPEPQKTVAKCAGRRLPESETRLPESERPYIEYNHTKNTNKETPTNHGGDGGLKPLYFGESLERKHLRDTEFLLRTVWPRLVAEGRVPDAPAGPHRLVTFAAEADRKFWSDPTIKDEMRLFVAVVSDGRFMSRDMADRDDETARRRILDFERRERGHPPPTVDLAGIGQSVGSISDQKHEYQRQVKTLAMARPRSRKTATEIAMAKQARQRQRVES